MKAGIEKGSFEFYKNYAEKEMSLQPEFYNESRRIIEKQFHEFTKKHKKKPIVLDVGAAGLLPYCISLTKKTIILDLFDKPKKIQLEKNCTWITADILSNNLNKILGKEKFDFIIMGGLLHHLCTKKNKAVQNAKSSFENSKKLLSKNGSILIIEHLMPPFITKLEDFFYNIYNFVLIDILKFTYVRFLSKKEVFQCLTGAGLFYKEILFNQPPYIAQVYWKVPKKWCLGNLVAISAHSN